MVVAPASLNLYFKSYFQSFICDAAEGHGAQRRVGVMRDDRRGRGRYQSEGTDAAEVFVVLLLRGPHVSSAPVSSSRPSPSLSPLENRIKRPGEPFIPNRNAASLVTAELLATSPSHEQAAKFNTAE